MREKPSTPRAPACPPESLVRYLAYYAQEARTAGFTASSVRAQQWKIKQLSQWLDERKIPASGLSEPVILEYLAARRLPGRALEGAPAAARRCLAHLRNLGVAPHAKPLLDDSPIGQLRRQYEDYLATERALDPKTLLKYAPFVRKFLVDRYGDGPCRLADLTARDVSQFVLRCARGNSSSRAHDMTAALRSFLRFLFQTGRIDIDIAASVPTVASWRLATVPKYISSADVQRLLDACPRDTERSKRDYAILLLLARLGLRAGDVAAMELDDIEWRTGEVQVRGKRSRDRFPLSEEVGAALASYIRRARPTCSTRRVFIRAIAPRRAISASRVGTVVRDALDRAGVKSVARGAHLLRHSLATTLLGAGATLGQIGTVLRHRRTATTEIYAKVDIPGLRSIARPWPRKVVAALASGDTGVIDYQDVDVQALRPLAAPWPTETEAT
jgi:site-specific recombinase XerD